MYLKYIQIVNYKNIQNARFEFGKGANTIIGENDSGKSNAMTAMRILLDSDYYYNTKRLKESDFSDSIGDWRGHWIIISAYFDEITDVDKVNEICAEISPDQENEEFLKSYIRCADKGYGTVTLYIRPNRKIRKQLFETSGDREKFQNVRASIQISDYEFAYRARSQEDFTNNEVYKKIVGDFEVGKYADPDNEDSFVLGSAIDILNLWEHVSVVFINALRDVESEMHKSKNPMKRIFETIQSQIDSDDIDGIKNKIKDLNKSLSGIKQIASIGTDINSKLQDIVGLVYSPEVSVESSLKEDIDSIARFLSLNPAGERDIDSLGLGHLNILYIALKLVEFEANRHHEILNIMIVEEPEAHVHTHIQKTLFDNLQLSKNYTQVVMTTHSTHISEVSNIENVNVMKRSKNGSLIMRPTNGLDIFGEKNLVGKNVSLTECLSRYLDAKRSVLLFSKGVILVEGDAEEIMIPALVKYGLGITLDEIGIGLINVGSVGFENIASIFDEERIQKYCSIVTDYDATVSGSSKSSEATEKLGKERKKKLDTLYKDNKWVEAFYAPHTFEVDFANIDENKDIFKKLVKLADFKRESTIESYENDINGTESQRYDAVMKLTERYKKGWMAIIMSGFLDATVGIPDYIISAIAFASAEVMNTQIEKKMLLTVLDHYQEAKALLQRLQVCSGECDFTDIKAEFIKDYPKDNLAKFFLYQDRMSENVE